MLADMDNYKAMFLHSEQASFNFYLRSMTSLLIDIACRKFLVEFLELQEAAATYCMGKKLIQIIQIKCSLSFGTAKNKTSQPNPEFYSFLKLHL
jgi:hypothetical protein